MKKYNSLEELKSEMLSLLLKEENDHGIPVIISFAEGTYIPDIKLDKENKILVNLFSDKYKKELFIITSTKGRTYYYFRVIPFEKVLSFELHKNYKNLKFIRGFENRYDEIISQLFKDIKMNQTKKLVFEFSDYVYLPKFDLEPIKNLKIDVAVKALSSDKGRNFKASLLFYLKNSNRRFLEKTYFPFQKCTKYENVESFMFDEANKNLIENLEDKNTQITIKATKVKEFKELVITFTDNINKKKFNNLFPLAFSLKFNKTNDRTHENCLVCGTKLHSNEQIYVHLLTDGNLTIIPESRIDNHFGFFPVGRECLSLVPENYHFTKETLINFNRRK